MEYIEGQSLEQILADSKEGKLEESQVIAIMKKMALGLLETHKKNVIHRDIKPANVMLTPDRQVKILDFGISYRVTTAMTELVGEHHRTGTWPYMAPEQLSTRYGRENKQLDIWGFGVTMYQLLTGKFPFANKDQIKDRNEKPYEMEGVSRKTRNLVMKCLEKDRRKRFQSMEQVLKALNSISMGKVKEKVKGKVKKAPRIKWMLMAAAVIVLVVLSVFLLDKFTQKDKPPVKEPKIVQKVVTADTMRENKKTIDDSKETSVEKIAKKVYQNEKGCLEADLGDGIIMVYIPAGNFTMGSNDYDDEKPPHEVFLDGYWLGKTEVTVKQFGLFVKDTGYKTEAEKSGGAYTWTGEKWEQKEGIDWKNPGFKQEDNHPVVCVSWNDVMEYCKWLSAKSDLNFILPTEAQWEKAARGTDQLKFPWGDHEPYYTGKWYANYSAHDSWEKRGKDGFEYTSPVGFYPQGASPYGLLDMAGNVWEWCSDYYDADYYKNKNAPQKNPTGPERGTLRVLRGGSWSGEAVLLRCAFRGSDDPSFRNDVVGFRLCQDN